MSGRALLYGASGFTGRLIAQHLCGQLDLVLAGRDDFQFPPEHQAILADRLPNAQLALVEFAGHNAPLERPDEVIEIVRRFMAGDEPIS